MADKEQEEPAHDQTAPGGRLSKERLIAEHGSAEAALQVLAYKLNEVERDGARYRARIRDLETEAEGGLLLKGDDKAAYEAYQALGAPGEIKARVEAGASAQERLKVLEHQGAVRRAAEVLGWDAEKTRTLAGDLKFEFEETKGADGEATVAVYIKNGQGDERTPAAEHETFKPWLDVLRPGPATETPAPRTGTRFVVQTPAGAAPKAGAAAPGEIASRKTHDAEYNVF